MFKLRVILYHLIKLYQYRKINIDKRCFYKRSKEVQIEFYTHCILPNSFLFFQFRTEKRTLRHDIVR